MVTYVGYGFNVENISTEIWALLLRKYKKYSNIRLEEAIADNPDCSEEDIVDDIIDEIGGADFIRDIINGEESAAAGTDYIVSSCDNHVMFDFVRFADDSPRTKYIRSEECFIEMIARYIPIKDVIFGNIWVGTEWVDPCYYME